MAYDRTTKIIENTNSESNSCALKQRQVAGSNTG